MKTFLCTDGNGQVRIEADSAREAAQEWVDTGDWGECSKTWWIDVNVTDEKSGESERITITVEPDEPECVDGHDHDWQNPIEVVGGIRDNPGVYGHGGGVKITAVCAHCRKYRVTDTWAQRPDTGEQGLESIEYLDADDSSIEWVQA